MLQFYMKVELTDQILRNDSILIRKNKQNAWEIEDSQL